MYYPVIEMISAIASDALEKPLSGGQTKKKTKTYSDPRPVLRGVIKLNTKLNKFYPLMLLKETNIFTPHKN